MNTETGEAWWSVRMRAAFEERHISGLERLVPEAQIEAVMAEMLKRARSRGVPADFIQITLEPCPVTKITRVPCLPVTTVTALDSEAAQKFAVKVLASVGVTEAVAHQACDSLRVGLGPNGTNLRGASLWDAQTGQRLEPDLLRGVRATRFDYSPEGKAAIDSALANAGLTHFRTREALAVATKVLWSGVLAELCWSDDAEYTTGYIATHTHGYVRIPGFKPPDARGGRVFFLDLRDISPEECLQRLEKAWVLIDPPRQLHPTKSMADYEF